ncbi:MAG: hypothetical protein KY463_11975, partial [Actinobacteria bacterium]|nr:hypothetical protein [Actinomycetota bacterium]
MHAVEAEQRRHAPDLVADVTRTRDFSPEVVSARWLDGATGPAVGARFDDRVTGNLAAFAPHARVIHVDIDPAEIGKNRTADVPIVGDCQVVIGQIVEALSELLQRDGVKPDYANWWETLRGWRSAHPLRAEQPADAAGEVLQQPRHSPELQRVRHLVERDPALELLGVGRQGPGGVREVGRDEQEAGGRLRIEDGELVLPEDALCEDAADGAHLDGQQRTGGGAQRRPEPPELLDHRVEQQPILPAAGTNRRLTIFGSVEAQGRGRIEVLGVRQDSAGFARYLAALDARHAATGRNIILVLDNGPCQIG